MAGTLTGIEPEKTAEPTKPGQARWYDKVVRGIRMKNGTGHAIQGDRHPDQMAEAVRWQICEGEIVQSIGRARGVNRTEANPVDIEIWNDLVLPVTVDQVVQWDQIPAGRDAEMAADGVWLESPTDMARCWPKVWETEKAARQWRDRAPSQTPIEGLLYRALGPCSGFSYQPAGLGRKWRHGRYWPAVVHELQSWLEARLEPLAGFRIDPPEPRLERAAPGKFMLREEAFAFPDPTALPLRWQDFAHHPSAGGTPGREVAPDLDPWSRTYDASQHYPIPLSMDVLF